jgi:hypothetical protein
MCTFSWSFEQELTLWSDMGVRHVGLLINKVADAPERKLKQLDDAGIRISTLIVGGFQLADRSTWAANQAAHREAIDMVAEHGGLSIYFTSGRTVRCDWDEDFALLAEAVAPTVAYGKQRGVIAALEPTTRTATSFVTTLADGIDVAERTGLGIVADLANVWTERGLPRTIQRAAPHVALWQIDDIVIGGLQHVLDTGYREVFDLEVVAADFTQPIDEAELRRGIAAASALLDRMGVK